MALAVAAIVALFFSFYLILRKFAGGVFVSSPEIIAAIPPLAFAFFAAVTSLFMILLPTAFSGILTAAILIVLGLTSFVKLRKVGNPVWLVDPSCKYEKIFYHFLVFVLGLFLSAFILVSFSQRSDGSFFLGGGSEVDTPYHLSQIIRIAVAEKWDFQEPNFAGEFIRYPYFINLISGLFLKLGLPLFYAFHIPLILLVFSGMFLLISFFRQLGFSRITVLFSSVGTLFGSGLGYFAYFSGLPGASLPTRMAAYPMQNISYPGMIPDFLIVQRPFLLGFPLFILILMLFLRGVKSEDRHFFLGSGFIAALLPFSHTHSFISLAITAGAVMSVLVFLKFELFLKFLRYFGYPLAALTIPQIAALMLLPKFPLAGAMHFRLGWMSATNQVGGLNLPESGALKFFPWLRYMWTNFGSLIFLPALLAVYFKKTLSNYVLTSLIAGALALWIVPNLIQFQVWDFDSNKFFSYAVLLSLAAAGIIVNSFTGLRKKVASAIFVIIILFSLPAALIASYNRLVRIKENGIIIFDVKQRQASDWIIKNTAENSVFLSSSSIVVKETIQNPIVVLAGRRTAAGFLTWIYTHGIDFLDRSAEIEKFLADPKNSDIPADYLIIDGRFRSSYPGLEFRVKAAGFETVYEDGPYSIVRLFTP